MTELQVSAVKLRALASFILSNICLHTLPGSSDTSASSKYTQPPMLYCGSRYNAANGGCFLFVVFWILTKKFTLRSDPLWCQSHLTIYLLQIILMEVTPVSMWCSQPLTSQRTSPTPRTCPAHSVYLLWVRMLKLVSLNTCEVWCSVCNRQQVCVHPVMCEWVSLLILKFDSTEFYNRITCTSVLFSARDLLFLVFVSKFIFVFFYLVFKWWFLFFVVLLVGNKIE